MPITTVAAIVAMGENRAIGNDNHLLWHLPDDLQHFKRLTLGQTVIMGRKTHESIGRPLPQRKNIILSNNLGFKAKGCITVHSVEKALAAALPDTTVFIIGGETIYAQFLAMTSRIYVTEVQDIPVGDAFFPALDKTQWRETSRLPHACDDRHPVPFSFVTLDRVR